VPGSLFREWKVALAFVAGIAMLAGAFVSDGGEHRYFERFKPRDTAPVAAAAPATPVTKPVVRPAYQSTPGGFGSDAELEAAFNDPDAVEAIGEANSDPVAGPPGSPDGEQNEALPEAGPAPLALPAALQP
jgi:hypothetical protein